MLCERGAVSDCSRASQQYQTKARALGYVKEQMYLCALQSCVHIIVSNPFQRDDEVELSSYIDKINTTTSVVRSEELDQTI